LNLRTLRPERKYDTLKRLSKPEGLTRTGLFTRADSPLTAPARTLVAEFPKAARASDPLQRGGATDVHR
jgi:hypothetical protein